MRTLGSYMLHMSVLTLLVPIQTPYSQQQQFAKRWVSLENGFLFHPLVCSAERLYERLDFSQLISWLVCMFEWIPTHVFKRKEPKRRRRRGPLHIASGAMSKCRAKTRHICSM